MRALCLGTCVAAGLTACGSAAKKTQTITFSSPAPAGAIAGGAPYEAIASSDSGLAVKVEAHGACTDGIEAGGFEAAVRLTGGSQSSPATVVPDKVGTCTVTARQAGNGTYEDAHASQTFKVQPNSPGVSDATRLKTAGADARALLAALALPAGSEPVSADPSKLLQQPAEEQSYRVALEKFWRVPGRPTAVLAWLEAHTPAGAGHPQLARRFNGSTPIEWFLEVSLAETPARPAYIASERLEIALAAARGGGTGLRADVRVDWVGSEGQRATT